MVFDTTDLNLLDKTLRKMNKNTGGEYCKDITIVSPNKQEYELYKDNPPLKLEKTDSIMELFKKENRRKIEKVSDYQYNDGNPCIAGYIIQHYTDI